MHSETEGSEQAGSARRRAVYVCLVSFLYSVIEDGDGTTEVWFCFLS